MPLSRRTFLLLTTASLSLSVMRSLAAAGMDTAQRLAPFRGVWEVERRPQEQSDEDEKRRRPSRFRSPPGKEAEPNDIIPDMSHGDRHVFGIMTEEGRAAFQAVGDDGLLAGNCRTPVMPRIARLPGLQSWRLTDGVLEIHHAYQDTRRTIHLDQRDAPRGTPSSRAGYASGWFEGDIFVIRTTHLAATPGGLSRHAPASDARIVEERYRLGANGDTLKGEFAIIDRKYLTKPIYLHAHLNRAPPGTPVEPVPCIEK
jgi:hypothetical protein